MKKFSAVLMAVLFASFTSAFAITPQQISEAMEEKGYTVVDVSDSMVAVSYRGLSVLIAVNGSDGDVSYLTYVEDVNADMLGYELLNRFNNEVKFGRAYVDQDGDIAIQMDRNAVGGVTIENIESDFDVFVSLVAKFISDVNNQVAV
jgi:hypothetical protein